MEEPKWVATHVVVAPNGHRTEIMLCKQNSRGDGPAYTKPEWDAGCDDCEHAREKGVWYLRGFRFDTGYVVKPIRNKWKPTHIAIDAQGNRIELKLYGTNSKGEGPAYTKSEWDEGHYRCTYFYERETWYAPDHLEEGRVVKISKTPAKSGQKEMTVEQETRDILKSLRDLETLYCPINEE